MKSTSLVSCSRPASAMKPVASRSATNRAWPANPSCCSAGRLASQRSVLWTIAANVRVVTVIPAVQARRRRAEQQPAGPPGALGYNRVWRVLRPENSTDDWARAREWLAAADTAAAAAGCDESGQRSIRAHLRGIGQRWGALVAIGRGGGPAH